MNEKMIAFLQLMRFHKPVGTLLLIAPTWMGLWVGARTAPPFQLFLYFTLGAIIMRALGCVLNDLCDQKFDAQVKRTQDRPLVTGKISQNEALFLATLLGLGAFWIAFQLNRYTLFLAALGAVLTVLYPLMKRFFSCPQLWLGCAFAWPVLMVCAEVNHTLTKESFWLFMAVFFWVIAYDTEYAMADIEDDKKAGVHSTARFFGQYDRHWIATFLFASLLMFVLLGLHLTAGPKYFLWCVVALMFIFAQLKMCKERAPNACLKAFQWNAALGFIWWLALVTTTS